MIEVYDIPGQGKSLLLNKNISLTQNSQQLDRYSEFLAKSVINTSKTYQNVLLIGGGDY
jgi:spermidine synthase